MKTLAIIILLIVLGASTVAAETITLSAADATQAQSLYTANPQNPSSIRAFEDSLYQNYLAAPLDSNGACTGFQHVLTSLSPEQNFCYKRTFGNGFTLSADYTQIISK